MSMAMDVGRPFVISHPVEVRIRYGPHGIRSRQQVELVLNKAASPSARVRPDARTTLLSRVECRVSSRYRGLRLEARS